MPTRLKREFVDDIRFRELSVYAERFYHRLHSKADDHGRYFGDLTILRSKLHPWDFDSVRNTDMSRWIAECEICAVPMVAANSAVHAPNGRATALSREM